MTSRPTRMRGDDGAVLVEFAFVGPILFFLLIGMLDVGLTVLGKAVASGAARDGARVGVIRFDNANNTGSANYLLISNAVKAKLVGHIASNPVVTVTCLDGGTKAAKSCARAGIAVDYDLIEVTVQWKSIAIDTFRLLPSTYTDRARMVITGDGIGTGGAPPPDCSTANVQLAFSTATPPPVTETNADFTTNVTIVRSGPDLSCWSQVKLSTGGGSATPGADYGAQTNVVLIFPPGLVNQVLPIVIKGDTVSEPTETFNVTLSAATGATIVAPAATTITILDDDGPPPALVSLQFFDVDTNGKIDRVVATFDQNLSASCPTPGAFVFTNTPSGGSRGAVSVAGAQATVVVTEGPGAPDTAGPGFQVRLDPGCLTASLSGAVVSFGNTTPADRAKPVLLSVTDTNGTTDGLAQAGDALAFTFSEPTAAAASPTVVTETPGSAGQLSINGIISTTNLNPKNNSEYALGGTLSFTSSPVTTSGSTVTVILGTCTTTCGFAMTGQSNNIGITFAASPSLGDPAGNTATGSVTTGNNYRLF